jgi:hypothetical protein
MYPFCVAWKGMNWMDDGDETRKRREGKFLILQDELRARRHKKKKEPPVQIDEETGEA